MAGNTRALIVDDEQEILEVMGDLIRTLGLDVRLARDGEEALRIFMAERPRLVITDLRMPRMDGLTLLRAIKEIDPRTEILIMTAYADLESAIQAVRLGAFDYLPKPLNFDAVAHRVNQALERQRLAAEKEALLQELEQRVRARTAALEESQRRLRALFHGIDDVLLIVDETLTIVAANEAAAAHAGAQVDDLAGRRCYEAMWGSQVPCGDCPVVTAFRTGRPAFALMTHEIGERGGRRDFVARSYPLDAPAGAPREAVEHIQDVTEEKRAEEERRALEAQRKADEAIRMIGGLAAGAAHDFNTLLGIIKGCAQLLLEAMPGGDRRRGDAERIEATADRGRRLVQELMAFSGAGLMEPRSMDVAALIEEMGPTLRPLLGDHIVLEVRAAPDLWRVHADPEQIEQVIMNMVVNAGDAIAAAGGPSPGGTVTLEMSNVGVGEQDATGLRPGRYVMLAVSDTGCGMTPEVRGRIFEPFFTTKPPGRGTGLGLATVSWIVSRGNGRVACESEPGQGTVFRIYLPRDEKA